MCKTSLTGWKNYTAKQKTLTTKPRRSIPFDRLRLLLKGNWRGGATSDSEDIFDANSGEDKSEDYNSDEVASSSCNNSHDDD